MPPVALHHSPYSGSWYPGDLEALSDLIEELFERSTGRTGSYLLPGAAAFVVPHAGLVYSGVVAASAYRHIKIQRPSRVILLGFAHRGVAQGLWLPEVEAYNTPIGAIQVDREMVRELLGIPGFQSMREDVLCDHSIEIQLPLIQKAAPGARVVPLYVSGPPVSLRRSAAAEIAQRLTRDTILLASSDFTHYGSGFRYKPFPCDEAIRSRLRLLDETFIDAASGLDPELFLETLDAEASTVCGRHPIAFLLEILRAFQAGDDLFQQKLDYQTSGEITGEYGHSVSYAALGYYPWSSFRLGEDDCRVLLESAYTTLSSYQRAGYATPVPIVRPSPALRRRAAAFVTLRQRGRLRGCVGCSKAEQPLESVVPEMTIAAAVDDTRFEPVKPSEHDLEIEISVLSPMKRIADPASFRIGRDGAYLKAGGRSGLLLPHVAEGRNWTGTEFLNALAHKAGATADVYRKPGTQLSVFRAQVIH